MVPCVFWLLALSWPAVLLSVRRARPAFACVRCEYDLRHNVSGVCPECGTTVTSPGPPAPQRPEPVRLVAFAAAAAAASVLTHASFVAVHLRHILDPANSPYGHESAFGDAVDCVQLPQLVPDVSLPSR